MTIASRRALIRLRNNFALYLGALVTVAAAVIAVEHLIELGVRLAAVRMMAGL